VDSEADACREAGVRGYPTWRINGMLFPGEKDLGEMEELLHTIDEAPK
jgi:2-hydroxychromene-2-carboxylate isomerase